MGSVFPHGFCLHLEYCDFLRLAVCLRATVVILGPGGSGSSPGEVPKTIDSAGILQRKWNSQVSIPRFLKIISTNTHLASVVQDVAIYLLPIPIIWNLQMPLNQKIALVSLLCVGLVAVAGMCSTKPFGK